MNLFVPTIIEADDDGYRTCGTCLERKPVSEFYRDGVDREGNIKYRRDCKECYRVSRLSKRRARRAPVTKGRAKRK